MIPADPALTAPTPAPAAAPAATRALIEGQLAMLSRLAQIGMEIAEAAGQEARTAAATAAAAPEEGAAPARGHRSDPALTFARAARAVRMTIALQSRLLKDLADLDRADERAARDRAFDRRRRLQRVVDQAARTAVEARRDAGQGWADEDAVEDEIELLSSDAYERLTEVEHGDLWGRSFDEVVAAVVKDLGLPPDWIAPLKAATGAPAGAAASVQVNTPVIQRPRPPARPASDLVVPAWMLAEAEQVLESLTGRERWRDP